MEGHIHTLLRFLRDADLTGLFIVAVVLAIIGKKTTNDRPALRMSSWGIAGAAFIAYLAYHISSGSGYGDELSDVAIRGLLGAVALAGAASIVSPLIAAVYAHTLGAGFDRLSRWKQSIAHRLRERQHRSMARQQEIKREAERKRQQARSEEENRLWAAAQRRRDEARASCEVLFSTHAPEIGRRFTREMFDDFVRKHMGDDQTPESVERRAEHLQGIIKSHLAKAGFSDKKMSLADLAAWFLKEKSEIEQTPLSAVDKQLLVAQLEERYVKLQEKHLRSVQP